MTFKNGQSGNPKGRPKGAVSKRLQLAKLLEPHAKQLIEKTIELALNGDTNALRLCIERLIPKLQREPIIDLPEHLDQTSLPQWKEAIMQAAINGQISADEAEKLIKLLNSQTHVNNNLNTFTDFPTDPILAAKVYLEMMG